MIHVVEMPRGTVPAAKKVGDPSWAELLWLYARRLRASVSSGLLMVQIFAALLAAVGCRAVCPESRFVQCACAPGWDDFGLQLGCTDGLWRGPCLPITGTCTIDQNVPLGVDEPDQAIHYRLDGRLAGGNNPIFARVLAKIVGCGNDSTT